MLIAFTSAIRVTSYHRKGRVSSLKLWSEDYCSCQNIAPSAPAEMISVRRCGRAKRKTISKTSQENFVYKAIAKMLFSKTFATKKQLNKLHNLKSSLFARYLFLSLGLQRSNKLSRYLMDSASCLESLDERHNIQFTTTMKGFRFLLTISRVGSTERRSRVRQEMQTKRRESR